MAHGTLPGIYLFASTRLFSGEHAFSKRLGRFAWLCRHLGQNRMRKYRREGNSENILQGFSRLQASVVAGMAVRALVLGNADDAASDYRTL